VPWRMLPLSIAVCISVFSLIHRLLRARKQPSEYNRFSTYVRVVRALFGVVSLTVCAIFRVGNIIVVWVYLLTCLFEFVRQNPILMNIFRDNFHIVTEYILFIFGICYFFSVFLFENPDLLKVEEMRPKINSFVNTLIMNVQIIGYDGWGALAKATLQHVI
jgi:hypothetical protein